MQSTEAGLLLERQSSYLTPLADVKRYTSQALIAECTSSLDSGDVPAL